MRRLGNIIRDKDEAAIFQTGADYNPNFELESLLQEKLPDFVVVMNDFRKTLDGVTGWRITWRHRTHGEIIGEDESLLDENTIIRMAVREQDQYHENHGWVVGSHVGSDLLFPSMISAWLEVSPEPGSPNGVLMQFDEMHAIELTPPHQVES